MGAELGRVLTVVPRGWTQPIEPGVLSYADQDPLLIPGSGVLEGDITIRADGRELIKDTNAIIGVVSSWTACVRRLLKDGGAEMVWPSSGGRTSVRMERMADGQVQIAVSSESGRVDGSVGYEALVREARLIAGALVSLLKAEGRNLRFQEAWACIAWDVRAMAEVREEE